MQTDIKAEADRLKTEAATLSENDIRQAIANGEISERDAVALRIQRHRERFRNAPSIVGGAR